MQNYNDETWLSSAIAYLSGELSKDDEIAFDELLKSNAELSQKFEILKQIWAYEIKEFKERGNCWDKIKHKINHEFAFAYYLRKANMETFDDKSVSLLQRIEKELTEDELTKIEHTVKIVFPDEKPVFIVPKKDIWQGIRREIMHEIKVKKRKKQASSMRNVSGKTKSLNRNVFLTAITSAAAVIALFLVLFVFLPENPSKYASDEPDEKLNPFTPDEIEKKSDTVDKSKKEIKDSEIIKKDEPDDDIVDKENETEIVEKPDEEKDDVIIKKDDSKKNDKKDVETVDDDEKPDVIKNDDKDNENKKRDDSKKKDSDDVVKVSETQEYVYRTKYADFDPEKVKFNTPSNLGLALSFKYSPDENKFNAYDVKIPTKTGGFKVSVDNNNNLMIDLNNDGVFEKRLTASVYKNFHLHYDDEKLSKVPYRLKFVRDKNSWSILPASGYIAKKAYMNASIMLIDANINGVFNDKDGDYFQFDEEEIQVLSTVNIAKDNWVKIIPDATGLSVKVLKHMPQNVGLLRIDAEYHNDITLRWLSIKGNAASLTTRADLIQDIILPVGEYKILRGCVGDGKTKVEFKGNEHFVFHISSGNATIIKIGGELSLSVKNYKKIDNKLIIHRNDLVLMGQCGEKYHLFRNKNNADLLNVVKAHITLEDKPNYLRNLNIQGTEGSDLIYITIPKFKEIGVYLLHLAEQQFSMFLTGEALTSAPIKINVFK